MELVTSSAQGNCSSFLKQREAKQLETLQHFDKALICSRFDTIKKFLGILEKKWGHAKWAQKSNILTTCGFMPCRIGLNSLGQWKACKVLFTSDTSSITKLKKFSLTFLNLHKRRFYWTLLFIVRDHVTQKGGTTIGYRK